MKPVRLVSGVRRVVYLVIACLLFVLGVLGALLPGLPATPFLLLTSYFLVRTSPGLNERMLSSRLFGPILRDWQERGGVTRRVKVQAVITVMLAISLTFWLSTIPMLARTVVLALASIGVVVIIRLPEVGDR